MASLSLSNTPVLYEEVMGVVLPDTALPSLTVSVVTVVTVTGSWGVSGWYGGANPPGELFPYSETAIEGVLELDDLLREGLPSERAEKSPEEGDAPACLLRGLWVDLSILVVSERVRVMALTLNFISGGGEQPQALGFHTYSPRGVLP